MPQQPRRQEKLSVGCPALDRLLVGGLSPGELVEVYGGRSSGRFSLVLTALAAASAGCGPVALVDLGDGLDPHTAAAAAVDLERLVWVRPQRLEEALESAEILMQSGVPQVVIDLGIPPILGDAAETSWFRLARSARKYGSALLLSSPYRVSGAAARCAVEALQSHVVWRGEDLAPQLLAGVSSRLELRDRRAGPRQAGPRQAGPRQAGPRQAGPRQAGSEAEILSLRAVEAIAGYRDDRLDEAPITTTFPYRDVA